MGVLNEKRCKNLFQINPNGPSSQTTLIPPYSTTGITPVVEYTSGWYILSFNYNGSVGSITFNNQTDITVYGVLVGGGGGTPDNTGAISASGANGGSVFNFYFTASLNQKYNFTIGSGGQPGAYGGYTSMSKDGETTLILAPAGSPGVLSDSYTGNPSGQEAYTNNTSWAKGISATLENSVTGGAGVYISSFKYQSSGKNGLGILIPPNSSRLEYFGGGGGSCGFYINFTGTLHSTAAGSCSGGAGGGGDGGYQYSNNLIYVISTNWINGRGGGGGGAFGTVGALGGDGIVILYFKYP